MPDPIIYRVLARHLRHAHAASDDTPEPWLDVIVAAVGVFATHDVTEDAADAPSAKVKRTGIIARRHVSGADQDCPQRQHECELEARIVQQGLERRLRELDQLRGKLAEVGREVVALVERLRALVEPSQRS